METSLLMEETTDKLEPWPTHLFDCCSGGRSLCLWGFLCPLCLELQADNYTSALAHSSFAQETAYYFSLDPVGESQFELYPPWSCRARDDCFDLTFSFFFGYCCCLYGYLSGRRRHEKFSFRINLEYYCSSQPCCCCPDFAIEDCLIGYFCCCCSAIQVTMANEERFRMQSKVEGDVNIKRAL